MQQLADNISIWDFQTLFFFWCLNGVCIQVRQNFFFQSERMLMQEMLLVSAKALLPNV